MRAADFPLLKQYLLQVAKGSNIGILQAMKIGGLGEQPHQNIFVVKPI
jgi:hypothetical protein